MKTHEVHSNGRNVSLATHNTVKFHWLKFDIWDHVISLHEKVTYLSFTNDKEAAYEKSQFFATRNRFAVVFDYFLPFCA